MIMKRNNKSFVNLKHPRQRSSSPIDSSNITQIARGERSFKYSHNISNPLSVNNTRDILSPRMDVIDQSPINSPILQSTSRVIGPGMGRSMITPSSIIKENNSSNFTREVSIR